MKEKIQELLKWVFLIAVAILLFYFLFPKYDFIKLYGKPFLRCNKITGSCDILRGVGENRHWENFVK